MFIKGFPYVACKIQFKRLAQNTTKTWSPSRKFDPIFVSNSQNKQWYTASQTSSCWLQVQVLLHQVARAPGTVPCRPASWGWWACSWSCGLHWHKKSAIRHVGHVLLSAYPTVDDLQLWWFLVVSLHLFCCALVGVASSVDFVWTSISALYSDLW